MPERPLTVATYAAGASLAAITLIYVFGPTFFLDGDGSSIGSSTSFWKGSSQKNSIVGLVNPANDCFINSVLQALAGLGDLRVYLIREVHRRTIDEKWVYEQPVPSSFDGKEGNFIQDAGVTARGPSNSTPAWKIEAQQKGLLTIGLKNILDQLNERPIYKKTISAGPFVRVMEIAFRQRINRSQQDAQEFLQLVAETLFEEYQAGRKARSYAKWKTGGLELVNSEDIGKTVGDVGVGLTQAEVKGLTSSSESDVPLSSAIPTAGEQLAEQDIAKGIEDGFPMEGKLEAQIECQTCGFKPKPLISTFCTLMLNVPQVQSTTLNACFDGMFQSESIEGYKCEKCKLVNAQQIIQAEAAKSSSPEVKRKAQESLAKIQHALETDPEKVVEGVLLPDSKYDPKRKIARSSRVVEFPKVLAIHLSRSIYDSNQASLKNSAKVAFPEELPLGGLLNRKKYRLLAMVAHKGSHSSGHYESFRRQHTYAPFSNPETFKTSQVYHQSTTPASTPRTRPLDRPESQDGVRASVMNLSPPDLSIQPPIVLDDARPSVSLSRMAQLTRGSLSSDRGASSSRGSGQLAETEASSIRSVGASLRSSLSRGAKASSNETSSGSRGFTPLQEGNVAIGQGHEMSKTNVHPKSRKRKTPELWWRISDDKVKEASTRELLGMQREVYLLFYELEKDY